MATTLEETKEQLLRAVAEIVAESGIEQVGTRLDKIEDQIGSVRGDLAKLQTEVARIDAKIDDRIGTAERNLRSDMNNMEQRILAAIDKLVNPLK